MGYFRDSRKMSSSVSTIAEEIAETISSFNYYKMLYKDKLPVYRLLVPMVSQVLQHSLLFVEQ
jgi:hypothetical protein